MFARILDHPGRPGETYSSGWLNMFRVKDGKVVELNDPKGTESRGVTQDMLTPDDWMKRDIMNRRGGEAPSILFLLNRFEH